MSKPHIGAKVSIATGLPTAFTEVAYEALTWVEIAGVLSHGELGDEHDMIGVPGDLATGRARDEKGEVKGKMIPLVCREITADAGQIALRAAGAAMGSAGEYSFRFSDPGSGTAPERYTSGYVSSLMDNEQDTKSYAGFKCDLGNNYGITRGT